MAVSDISQQPEAQEAAGEQYPPAFYGWYVTILLTIIYVLSFVDRQILSLLVEPIKADIALSDTQIGLLMGASFAIFYATMGLPLGWLADRMKRKYLLGMGIFVWSVATALSGFAASFRHLFAARVLVGAGEATLGPCAISLISDVMPPSRRARAIGVYSSALSIAIAIAYLLGGQALRLAELIDFSAIPLLADLKPWQLVLIAVGSPGVIFSLLILLMREPKRLERDASAEQLAKFSEVIGYFTARAKFFSLLFMLPVAMTIISYSHNFIPSLFYRHHGWDPVKLSVYIGTMMLMIGPASTFFGGFLVDRLHNRGVRDGGIRVMRLGALIMVPNAIAFPLMPTPELTLFFYGCCTIGMTILTAAAFPSILQVVPAEIRGQSTAVYLMVISLFGLLLGPTLVGVFNDYLFQDEQMLRWSMALVPIIFGSFALLFIPLIVKIYRRQINV